MATRNTESQSHPPYFFAAVGDVHGHMDAMVSALTRWEKETANPLSFVVQVGDFEPHRSDADLSTMAAPSRYRQLGDFSRYLSGQRSFPWPIYFIGGNHEPYGFLDRVQSGDEVAPNCIYLGRVGVMQIQTLTVASLSGIFVPERFQERPNIDAVAKVSNKAFIGFTEAEVARLVDEPRADVLVVHEWPSGIIAAEDEAAFERQRRSMRYSDVGNEYARLAMDQLQPQLLLCGHMHKPYRNKVGTTQICALANVQAGADAFAVFRVEQGAIREHQPGVSVS